MKYKAFLAIAIASILVVVAFQNCAPKNFSLLKEGAFSSLGALATFEDTPAQMKVSSNVHQAKYSIQSTGGILRTQHGTISNFSEDGTFFYTPDPDYHGSDQFTFEVRGNDNVHFIKDTNIRIEPVNDSPTVADARLTIELNKPLVFSIAQITASDIEKDILNIWMIDADRKPITSKSGDWGSLRWLRAEGGLNFYEFKTQSLGAHTHKFMVDDGNGGKVDFNITFTAENPLLAFKPALAVRNMACLNCHANIKGNIITDYRANAGEQVALHGTQSNGGAGDFLGGNWAWRSRAFVSLNLHNGTFFVPKRELTAASQSGVTSAFQQGRDNKIVNLPGWGGSANPADSTAYDPAIDLAAKTIADYINAAVNHRTPGYLNEILNDPAFPKPSTITQDSNIREVHDVKIGSVSAEQLKSVFGTSFKYIRQGDDGYQLKNFSKTGAFYSNVPDQWLECDGDVFVPGTVLLKNLKIKSKYGCRIHASGTIFLQAPVSNVVGRQGIIYDNEAKAHLQLMSSKAILMGLGDCSVKDKLHGDTIEHRIADERTATPTLVGLGVVEDYNLFLGADNEHIIKDASNCEGNYLDPRRNVAFSKLLINAPVVHSRYTGNFNGVIIADHMVGSLGKFAYEYDSIFTRSPIFPQLPSDWFFNVRDCASYDLQTGNRTSDQSQAVANEPKMRKCQL